MDSLSRLLAYSHLDHFTSFQLAMAAFLILLQGAVFTIFPEEVVLIGLGILAGRGQIPWTEAWLASALGLLGANFGMYWLGRLIGERILRIRPFCWIIQEKWALAAQSRIKREGPLLIFLTRFTPLVRGPVYAASGISGLKPMAFLSADVAGGLIQIPALIWAGVVFGRNPERLMSAFHSFAIAAFGVWAVFAMVRFSRRAPALDASNGSAPTTH